MILGLLTLLACQDADAPAPTVLRVSVRDVWSFEPDDPEGEVSGGLGFVLERPSGERVAVVHGHGLLQLNETSGMLWTDETYGLWPDPFGLDVDRVAVELRDPVGTGPPLVLDGPAFAAEDYTHVVGFAIGEADARASMLRPSWEEVEAGQTLTVIHLDGAGAEQSARVQVARPVDFDRDDYWLQAAKPDGSGWLEDDELLGAPLLVDGQVIGAVAKVEGGTLFAQPLFELLPATAYWRPLWTHDIETWIDAASADAEGSRVLLAGDAVEVLELGSLRLLARIDPLDLDDAQASFVIENHGWSAALSPDGTRAALAWPGAVHEVALEGGEPPFDPVLGPNLYDARHPFDVAPELQYLPDGSLLLTSTGEDALRVFPDLERTTSMDLGGAIDLLPVRHGAQLVREGVGTFELFDFGRRRVGPRLEPVEPVSPSLVALSPSGAWLALVDFQEQWIDVLPCTTDGKVEPRGTVFGAASLVEALGFAGEDHLVVGGDTSFWGEDGEWYPGEGLVSLHAIDDGSEPARSGEFAGGVVDLVPLPDGTWLAVTTAGELSRFDPGPFVTDR